MRVLLLGEYSGFYLNLKNGLRAIGIECVLAASGDGWKKIEGADINLFGKKKNNKFQILLSSFLYPLFHRKALYGFDVVLMIGPKVFPRQINGFMIRSIKKHSKSLLISVAGDCYSVYDSFKKGLLKYYTYTNNPEACKQYDGLSRESKKAIRQEKYIYNLCDGIIPIMFEYAVGLDGYQNRLKTIPLPFDFTKVDYSPNIVKDRIVIMHGVIKEKYKGTDIILEALNEIKRRHPNEVEIIIDGKMPLNQYLKKLSSVNILIDQCKEHCYGLNALYALAMGRIVFGGASKQSLEEFGVDDCPVIHIEPNKEMIVNKIEQVLLNKDSFEKLGLISRQYVERVHNCFDIAKKYESVFESVLRKKGEKKQ